MLPGLFARQIRLMTLSPGKWDDPISFRLRPAFLDQNTPYKALSYAWGSSKNLQEVTSNGRPIKITVNLRNSLRRLRRVDEELVLWVDAVCINQWDVRERNHQVAMMRDIYAQCQEVIVFLGESWNPLFECKTSHHTVEVYFDNRDRKRMDDFKHGRWGCRKQCRGDMPGEVDVFCLLRLMAEAVSDPDVHTWFHETVQSRESQYRQHLFEILRLMMQAKWWSRVWVVQEIVVPDKASICYGSAVAPWEMLVQAASFYSDYRQAKSVSIPHEYRCVLDDYTRKIMGIHRMRESWRNDQKPALLVLLKQFSARVSSEECDKVYALLGLATEKTRISPDYSLSLPQVFQNIVLADIGHRKGLSILVGDLSRKERDDIPSWVPDWTTASDDLVSRRVESTISYNATPRSSITSLQISDGALDSLYSEFCAVIPDQHSVSQIRELESRFLPAINQRFITDFEYDSPFFGGGDGQVSIPGSYVDEVIAVGNPSFSAADLTKSAHDWMLLHERFASIAENRLYDNQTVGEAFLRTLCADISCLEPIPQRIPSTHCDSIIAWFLNGEGSPFKEIEDIPSRYYSIRRDIRNSQSIVRMPGISEAFRCATHLRRFYVTKTGYIGLGPLKMEVGDEIVLFSGSRTPFIVRETVHPHQTETGHDNSRGAMFFKLIGDCYTHGAMDGRAPGVKPPMFPIILRQLKHGLWINAASQMSLYNWASKYIKERLQEATLSWKRFMQQSEAELRKRHQASILGQHPISGDISDLNDLWQRAASDGLVHDDERRKYEAFRRFPRFTTESLENVVDKARGSYEELVSLNRDLLFAQGCMKEAESRLTLELQLLGYYTLV